MAISSILQSYQDLQEIFHKLYNIFRSYELSAPRPQKMKSAHRQQVGAFAFYLAVVTRISLIEWFVEIIRVSVKYI